MAEIAGERRWNRNAVGRPRSTWAAAVVVAVICAGGLAACSSSGSSTSSSAPASSSAAVGGSASSSASGGGSASSSASGAGSASSTVDLTQAKAIEASYEQRPASIPITAPLKGTVPSGKVVDFINCGVAQCTTVYDNFASAAAKFGWTTKDILSTGAPASVNAAVQQAANSHPGAVVLDGLTRAQFAGPLAQLKADGIPVLESSVTDQAGDGVSAVINGPAVFGQLGQAFAAWAVAENNGKPNVLYVNDPDLVIFASMGESAQAEYQKLCPGCSFSEINIPSENFGQQATTTIVSYLLAHRSVNTVIYSIGNLDVGVPAALSSAGIKGIKAIDQGSTPENLSYVAAGQETSTAPYPLSYAGYQLADTLARVFLGQPATPDDAGRYPWWIVNKSDDPGTNMGFATIPDFQQDFLKLWQK